MDWPQAPPLGDTHLHVINPLGACGFGYPLVGSVSSSAAFPAANRAVFQPIRIPTPVTVYQMSCATGTVGTNSNTIDLGIYDVAGNLLVSTGTFQRSASSVERIVNITDTVLLPGMYYLAMSCNSNDNMTGYGLVNAQVSKFFGMREMASAHALPSTATFATHTGTHMPLIAAIMRAE